MRKKFINILFANQSCLDFLCALLLIFSARVKTFFPEGGHFGVKGKDYFAKSAKKTKPSGKNN